MNSGRPERIVVWLMLLVAATGCTSDQPFEAEFTEDGDWTPSIQLAQNDYSRIVLNIDRPPRLSLLKNITRYQVFLQAKENLSIVRHDTIPGSWISPAYLFPTYPHPYYSGPVLNHEAEYIAKVNIVYNSGSAFESNEIMFRTPASRGDLVKVLPLPRKNGATIYFYDGFLSLYKGGLIILNEFMVFRTDTSSGDGILLKDNFLQPGYNPQIPFRSFAIVGNMLVTFYVDWPTRKTTLVHLNLETLDVDSSVTVSFPNATPMSLISFDGGILIQLFKGEDQQQFVKLDPISGDILEEYPSFSWAGFHVNDLASEDQTIWVSERREYDNRLIQMDPSTGAVLRTFPNPVFRPQTLAFDGSHFWQIDTEMQKIVKVRPAGF